MNIPLVLALLLRALMQKQEARDKGILDLHAQILARLGEQELRRKG